VTFPHPTGSSGELTVAKHGGEVACASDWGARAEHQSNVGKNI
jgi:hypothetical protein